MPDPRSPRPGFPSWVSHRARALGPAGLAIVLGIGLGTIIVSNGPGAERAATTLSSVSTNPVTAPLGATLPQVAPELAPTTDLGPLGDVGTAARLRTAANAAARRGPLPTGSTPAPPCTRTAPPAVGLVLVGAYATGTVGAVSVTVLVGTAANGTRVAAALRSDDCSLALRVDLGS